VGGPQPLFILGTGPGVGKTLVACGVLSALKARGITAAGIKPAETGCPYGEDHDLIGRDGARLRAAGAPLPPLVASPYRFAPPLSPAVAAEQAGLLLTLEELAQAVHAAARFGRVVVEGPGGPLCPVAQDGATADLAVHLGAAVLVVGADREGGDGQALLTLEACARRGLDVRGVLLSRRDVDAGRLFNEPSIAARAAAAVFPTLATLEADDLHAVARHLEAHLVLDALLR
jgi:dethiobiotin synthetase